MSTSPRGLPGTITAAGGCCGCEGGLWYPPRARRGDAEARWLQREHGEAALALLAGARAAFDRTV